MYQLFTTYDYMAQNIFSNNVHQGIVFSAARDSSTSTSTSRTSFITAGSLGSVFHLKKNSHELDAIIL